MVPVSCSVQSASPTASHADAFKITATKLGAIVAGQTSVKDPERLAFEKYLPADVSIISVHSLHGPTVPTDGQALVSISLFPPPASHPSRGYLD